MSIANQTYSAVRWATVATVARASLQLLQVAVLARFLSPLDYGLMAMVAVILGYVSLFSEMGLSTAFVQRQQISHEERSSLYWLSVVVGLGLMLLIMAMSPLVAMFFKEPRLMPLLMLLATNFTANAIGQQLRMTAEKSLNFRPIALIEITSALAGFIVAVVTGWLGWGVFALVSAAMTSAWLIAILAWLILAQGWRPCWRLHWHEVRWFVGFGGGMLLNNLLSHMNATMDLILGGRLLGASQLGLYSIPRNLILQVQLMINPIFTRVGFPLIASMQDQKERVKQVYLRTLNLTASVNAPLYVALCIFAPEFVLLLLGPRWTEVTPLMRVLAVWGLLRSFTNPVGSLLFGLGNVRLATKWNAALLLIIPPAIWFGSQWGSIGMAWAMVALMAVLFIPGWAILVRPSCGIELGEYLKQVGIPALLAIVSGAVSWCAIEAIDRPVYRLALGLPFAGVAYFALSRAFNREWSDLLLRTISGKLGYAGAGQ